MRAPAGLARHVPLVGSIASYERAWVPTQYGTHYTQWGGPRHWPAGHALGSS
jgi:hypothetical protein